MTDIQSFNRTAVVRRIRDLVRNAAPADVEVSRGFDLSRPTDRVIAVGDVRGLETQVASMRAGRKSNSDSFVVEVICIAWEDGTSEFDDVDAGAEVLGELVRSQVAEHAQLDHTGDGLPGVVGAHVSLVDGPNPWRTETGVASVIRVEITVTARIN